MDGRGRCLDNVFVERLWRTVKYEEVYLRDYGSVPEALAGLSGASVINCCCDELKALWSNILQANLA